MTEKASRRDFLPEGVRGRRGRGSVQRRRRGTGAKRSMSSPIPQADHAHRSAPDGVVNVAVIGTGGMGTGHADALARFAAQSKSIRLAALCDLCDPRVQNAKARVDKVQGGEVATYRHYEASARAAATFTAC